MTITKSFVAPALPVPTSEYSQPQQTDTSRSLRLYFNLLDKFFANTILDALNGGAGGNGISFPHIAANHSANQYATASNTPTVVAWNTLDSGYLWTLNSPGSATAAVAGVYTIRYSLQFVNTANVAHDAWVWLRKNGTDVPGSTSRFSLAARKSASDFTYNLGYSEATFSVAVEDEIELLWATDQAYSTSGPVDGIYMFANTAQTSPFARPSLPSAIGSITYVSAIPPS